MKTAVRGAVLLAVMAMGANAGALDAQAAPASGQVAPVQSAADQFSPPHLVPLAQASSADETSIENHPLDDSGGAIADSGSKAVPAAQSGRGLDLFRVSLSLAVVLGLILVLRIAARKILPGAGTQRVTQAIKVLSRCSVSPRQNLLLVQVGKRLILVGDGGAQLAALTEFHEGPEAEALLAQIRQETVATASKFESLFGKAEAEFAKGDESDQPGESSGDSDRTSQGETIQGEVLAQDRPPDNGLIHRPSRIADAFDPSHEIADPSLHATQKEILGLSEKVRELARQLRG